MSETKEDLTPAEKRARTMAAKKAAKEAEEKAAAAKVDESTNNAPGVFDPDEAGADARTAPQPTIQGFDVPEAEEENGALPDEEIDKIIPPESVEEKKVTYVMASNGKPLLHQVDMVVGSRKFKAGEKLQEGVLDNGAIRRHLRAGNFHTELPLHLRQKEAEGASLLR